MNVWGLFPKEVKDQVSNVVIIQMLKWIYERFVQLLIDLIVLMELETTGEKK